MTLLRDSVIEKYPLPDRHGAERHDMEYHIYTLLDQHPRILPFLGKDSLTGALKFPLQQHGSISSCLTYHPTPSLDMRLRWVSQMAEGICYLHSRDVTWVDCQLGNFLITDDFDIVLADFAGSICGQDLPRILPPDYYLHPDLVKMEFDGLVQKTHDIFAFGICMFIILGLRVPHRQETYADFMNQIITVDEMKQIAERHKAGDFDRLSQKTFPHLAEIVDKCLRSKYSSMQCVLKDLEIGCVAFIQECNVTGQKDRSLGSRFDFENGSQATPINMGHLSFPYAVISIVWLIFITVVFFFAPFPLVLSHSHNMTHIIIISGGWFLLPLVWYYSSKCGGAYWFRRQIANVLDANRGRILHGLGSKE